MIFEGIVNFCIISLTVAFYPPEHLISSIYSGDYPSDYDPDSNSDPSDPERMTFDGIYERRKNFDIEPLNDDQSQSPESADPFDYNMPLSPDINHDNRDNRNHDLADDEVSESQSTSESKPSFLADGCLRCLCEASSDCDPQVRCHVEGPTDYNCGPFQISINYWSDAGSPGADQSDPMDFEECMNDIECSIETVNTYMKKWSKDCDGDGRVSCDDYAKIHKAGHYQCNSSWILSTPFWNKYKDCYFEYR